MITIEEAFWPKHFYPNICGEERSLLLFDIETTGFSREYNHIYLIGAAARINGQWTLMQWFAQNPQEEGQVIQAFLEFAKGTEVLIHFNGKAFDLPYTKARADFWEIPFDLEFEEQIDLMTVIKPYKKLCGLSNIKQKSIEQLLGMTTREDTMSGGELIPVYHYYVRHQDQKSLHLLLLHNADDVRGMADLTQIGLICDFLQGPFTYDRMECIETGVLIHYRSPIKLPYLLSADYDCYSISAGGDTLSLGLPYTQGCLRHYFPDYKDYFYLPAEHMVVHKSVAQFVDQSAKKKATKQNCFVEKEGCFLPQPTASVTPAFQKDVKDKMYWFEVTNPEEQLTPELLQEFLKSFLQRI